MTTLTDSLAHRSAEGSHASSVVAATRPDAPAIRTLLWQAGLLGLSADALLHDTLTGPALAIWVAVLVAVVSASAPAHAYLKFGVDVGGRTVAVRWTPGAIRYYVHERDFSGISPQAFSDAIGRATGGSIAIEKIPSRAAGPYGWLVDLIAAGLYEPETPDLARLLGRKPTSLDDFVASLVRTTSRP